MIDNEIAPAPYEQDTRLVKKGFTKVLSKTFYYPLLSIKNKGIITLHPFNGVYFTAEPGGEFIHEFKSYQEYLKLKRSLTNNTSLSILGHSFNTYIAKVKKSCAIENFQTLGYFFEDRVKGAEHGKR